MNWFVYIIESSDSSYYTGITTDIERRFEQHLNGTGARFFSGRKPIKIVYSESGHSKTSAARREYEIKKLTRKEKLRLIGYMPKAI